MNNHFNALFTFCLVLSVVCCCHTHRAIPVDEINTDTSSYEVSSLLLSYPESIVGFEGGNLLFTNGDKLLFDDGKEKSFIQLMECPDIQDMFSILYSNGDNEPEYLHDPGRIRCEAFFKIIYGVSESKVRSHLVQVDWFGDKKLLFNRINGAADSLRAVYIELTNLPQEYHKYLTCASSFYWRKVRGANRLSPHSYGIAIDINTSYSDYWRWAYPQATELDQLVYRNQIPEEIVKIFEKHGFISGTRWYHFDTMHFEYRPELLLYSSIKHD